jgi:hypothetical protein
VSNLSQPDFGAGIYRGRKAPQGAAYDLVNALVSDEGQPFRRGPSAYHSASDAGVNLVHIATPTLAGPDADRVIAWGTKFYTLDGTTPVEIYDAGAVVLGRPVGVGGLIAWPAPQGAALGYTYSQIVLYGGSLLDLTTDVTGGTITVTNGSTAVTKVGGASWVGAVDAGMFVKLAAGYGIVRYVTADAIDLAYPWSGATATTTSYDIVTNILMIVGASLPTGIPASNAIVLGTAAQRLLVGIGNRVYECAPGFPFDFDPNAYNELPAASRALGIESLGDTAMVFSTRGVHTIGNLALDIVDDLGNPQQPVNQLSGDIILWGEHGLAGYSPGVVVPALDDVYILTLDGGATVVSDAIRPVYRAHVAAGRSPGTASIHRGHYFLPIFEGAETVDVLVCRLDRPFQTPSGRVFRPWTRWAGHAAGPGYAVLHASGAPKLLGLAGKRVTDLTATLDGGTGLDADGTSSDYVLTTTDYAMGGRQGTAQKLRLRYELTVEDASADWTGNPWNLGNAPLGIVDGVFAGSVGANTSRSWLNTGTQSVALTAQTVLGVRPAENVDALVYSALGFVQDPGTPTASGYEARFRYEAASDKVAIYRYDDTNLTRILDPVALPERIKPGDTLKFEIEAGFLVATVNGVTAGVVASTAYFNAAEPAYVTMGIVDQLPSFSARSAIRHGQLVGVEYSSDHDGGVFTALVRGAMEGGGNVGAPSDGSRYSWWRVGKRRDRIRFRVTVGGTASFVLRELDLIFRPSGRQ